MIKRKQLWNKITAGILAVLIGLTAVPLSAFAAPEEEEAKESGTASWTELEERRESASRTFLSPEGNEVTALYPYPVFYENEDGSEWIPYDYRLELVANEEDVKEYQVRDGSMDSSVRRFFSGGEFLRLGYGENGGSMAFSLPATGSSGKRLPEFKIQAGLYDEKDAARMNRVSEERVAAEFIRNYGICEDALNGIDIGVEQWPGNVILSIAFQKSSRAKEGLALSLALDGMTFEEKQDGSLHLFAGEEEKAVLEAPVVYDGRRALGKASYMISEREDGAFQILVLPDGAWMEEVARVSPITVDLRIRQTGIEEAISTEVQSTEGYVSSVPVAVGNTRETIQTKISLPDLPELEKGKTLENVSLLFSRSEALGKPEGNLKLGAYKTQSAGESTGELMDSATYKADDKTDVCMLDITKAYDRESGQGSEVVLKSVQTELVTGVYGFDFFVSDMLLPLLLVSSTGTGTVESLENSTVVGEDTEKRDRFTKHFLTGDGGYVAAVYEMPVHYKSDGVWKEIDNTLISDGAEGTQEAYTNRASDVKVKFARYLSSGKQVWMESVEGTFSWDLLDQEAEKEFVLESQKEAGTGESASGEGRYLESSESRAGGSISAYNARQMKRTGLTSGGTYQGIRKDMDIQYVLDSVKVKESIILRSTEAAKTPLEFRVSHPGMEMSLEADGSVVLKKNQKTVYIFASPYMYDWAGDISEAVKFQVEKEGSDMSILTIEPDMDWLTAKERTYPVAVERLVKCEGENEAVESAFVRETQPEEAAEKEAPLAVGYFSGYGVSRTLLKLTHLPQLSAGDRIYKGILNLYQNQYSSKRTSDFSVVSYPVLEEWTREVTWSSQPSFDETVLDSQTAEKLETAEPGSVLALKQFDITSQASDWYAGENYGLLFASLEENTKAGAGYTVSGASSRRDPYPSTQYPTGLFYYRQESGVSESKSMQIQDGLRAGTGYVSDFSGNLTFVHEDIVGEESRIPGGLSHRYDLGTSEEASFYGNGWSLSAVEKLEITGLSELPYIYTDENGVRHPFYTDKRDENRQKDMDGLGLVITEGTSGEGQESWILTGADGTEWAFDADGFLSRKKYGGTELFYHYAEPGRLVSISDEAGPWVSLSYDETGTKLVSLTDETTGKTFSYQYDEIGNLTRILHPDGKANVYSYDGKSLIRAKASDQTTVEYLYADESGAKRVHMTRRWDGNGTEGETVTYTYQDSAATEVCYQTEEGRPVYTYSFDRQGRPLTISDDKGRGNVYTDVRENSPEDALEEGERAGEHNLLENGSFEQTEEKNGIVGWSAQEPALEDGFSEENSRLGKASVRIGGTEKNRGSLSQTVDVTGLEGDRYYLSGWARAEAVPAGEFRLGVEIHYSDGSHGWRYVNFDARRKAWQYAGGAFTVDDGKEDTALSYTGFTVHLFYNGQYNPAWFDSISLTKM